MVRLFLIYLYFLEIPITLAFCTHEFYRRKPSERGGQWTLLWGNKHPSHNNFHHQYRDKAKDSILSLRRFDFGSEKYNRELPHLLVCAWFSQYYFDLCVWAHGDPSPPRTQTFVLSFHCDFVLFEDTRSFCHWEIYHISIRSEQEGEGFLEVDSARG